MCAVPLRISDSTPGAILQPQPPPWESEVRRGWARGAVGVFMGVVVQNLVNQQVQVALLGGGVEERGAPGALRGQLSQVARRRV